MCVCRVLFLHVFRPTTNHQRSRNAPCMWGGHTGELWWSRELQKERKKKKMPKIIVKFDCFMTHDSFNLIVMIMGVHSIATTCCAKTYASTFAYVCMIRVRRLFRSSCSKWKQKRGSPLNETISIVAEFWPETQNVQPEIADVFVLLLFFFTPRARSSPSNELGEVNSSHIVSKFCWLCFAFCLVLLSVQIALIVIKWILGNEQRL